jgi:hypothetical protein
MLERVMELPAIEGGSMLKARLQEVGRSNVGEGMKLALSQFDWANDVPDVTKPMKIANVRVFRIR